MVISRRSNGRIEQIVQAATRLFAQQGYHGTTTRQIAQLSDVSENTLFRHFSHKEDLFWTALKSELGEVRFRRGLAAALAECRSPEIVIPELVDMLVETSLYRPQLLRIVAVAYLELGWKASPLWEEHLAPIISVLGKYLDACIQSGKIRNLDSAMLMAALSSTVMVHPELARMLKAERSPHGDRREAVAAYSKFWMELLLVPGHRVPSPARI